MKYSAVILLVVISFNCTQRHHGTFITINRTMLDSIKSKSDTSYSKHYRNTDFVTAEYFLNRKDSTICQLMKDSSGNIRQILVVKKNLKLFGAEYYRNGQLVAELLVDAEGKYNGKATYYYESGLVKNSGFYVKGFHTGEWKNYNINGTLLSIDRYNDNGELVKTTNEK